MSKRGLKKRGLNKPTLREMMIKYGNSQKFMDYFGINHRHWLDKTPIENYKASRGI